MNRTKLAIAIVATAGMVGCSSVTISNDFDAQANFGAYKTYTWAQPPQSAAKGFWDGRIRKAVDTQLQAKGLTQAPEGAEADLHVAYVAALDKQVRVDTTGYGGYGYGWRYGGGMSTSTVTEVPVGTLIVDLVDAPKKQLVWRGKASGTLDNASDPDAAQVKLEKTMAQVFEAYPPKAKK